MPKAKQTAIKRFALFFKSYGIALGVIVAAMPFATRAGGLLPGYQAVRDTLTFATSLLTLLAIAFLFSFRREIGRAVFPGRPGRSISRKEWQRRVRFGTATPIVLGVLAILGLVGYLICLNLSIYEVAGTSAPIEKDYMAQILAERPFVGIPYLAPICLSYTIMFFGAATAFVWTGLIEYVQSELGITDVQLITEPYVLMNRHQFKLDDDATIEGSAPYFYFEWDAQTRNPVPHVVGPLCDIHRGRLQYDGKESAGRYRWACISSDKDKEHIFILSYDSIEIGQRAKNKAEILLQMELQKLA